VFWSLAFSPKAQKEFKKLDVSVQKQIREYFFQRVLKAPDPLVFAKHLRYDLSDFYRFRIENYCVLCSVQRHKLTIHVVKIGHRREVYD